MFRKSRKCPDCGGRQYLRTSHKGKAGTWRCIWCGRIDHKEHILPNTRTIDLYAKCSKCNQNLKVDLNPDPDLRIPYCSIHGEVRI